MSWAHPEQHLQMSSIGVKSQLNLSSQKHLYIYIYFLNSNCKRKRKKECKLTVFLDRLVLAVVPAFLVVVDLVVFFLGEVFFSPDSAFTGLPLPSLASFSFLGAAFLVVAGFLAVVFFTAVVAFFLGAAF